MEPRNRQSESLKNTAEAWLKSQNKEFYFQGIHSVQEKWESALMLQENILK